MICLSNPLPRLQTYLSSLDGSVRGRQFEQLALFEMIYQSVACLKVFKAFAHFPEAFGFLRWGGAFLDRIAQLRFLYCKTLHAPLVLRLVD